MINTQSAKRMALSARAHVSASSPTSWPAARTAGYIGGQVVMPSGPSLTKPRPAQQIIRCRQVVPAVGRHADAQARGGQRQGHGDEHPWKRERGGVEALAGGLGVPGAIGAGCRCVCHS